MTAPDRPERRGVYVISVAAELAGMHPQTLRAYDRMGLVSPDRSAGRSRRYSAADLERLHQVQRLSQDEGLNLEGIRRVLDLQDQVTALQEEVARLTGELARAEADADARVAAAHASYRREIVPRHRDQAALVLWQRRRRVTR